MSPKKNKILPDKRPLTQKERVWRTIQKQFKGEEFTLKDLSRVLSPRVKLVTLKIYIRDFTRDLRLIRRAIDGKAAYYREGDALKDLIDKAASNSPADFAVNVTIGNLYAMAQRARKGHVIQETDLAHERDLVHGHIEWLQQDLEWLRALYNCEDLWKPDTLVKRIGFIGDDRNGPH